MTDLHFEIVTYTGDGWKGKHELRRVKVPGGWLLSVCGYREDSLCFYPDPKHLWLKDRKLEDIRLIRVDFDEVPENEGCMVKDDWPHAIIGQREAA